MSLTFAREGQSDASTTPTVATVRMASGAVKVRPALTLGWASARVGSDVHDGDAVFVPPGAEATLTFLDGTELAVDERSLVVVELPRSGGRNVLLRQGSLTSRAGREGLTLTTPVGEARIGADSEARVELSGKKLEVSVGKGTAQVTSASGVRKTVGLGERVAAAENGTAELAAWPIRLTAPKAHERFPYRGAPGAVTLSWLGEVPPSAKIQLARDRLFAFFDVELPVSGANVEVPAPLVGITWWRMVDADGVPISESRRFSFVEDMPPVAMFPRNGDVLLAPPGTEVSFQWASVPNVKNYRLEVASTPTFEPLKFSKTVDSSSARVALSLDEAAWFWRVRAEHESDLGWPSAPFRFRVIHRGIPEAPELFNPEIEVTP